jgi:hypothetical protein
MSRRLPTYGVLLLFLAILPTACDNVTVSTTHPSTLPAAADPRTTFDFQPAWLQPEFLPAVSCVGGSVFGTRIIVVVSGGTEVIVRGFGFRFTDHSGRTTLPSVRPIPGSSPLTTPVTSIPTTFPIPIPGVGPLPSASPILVPGFPPINGVRVPAGGSLTFPFFLTFDCGIVPAGMLFVGIDQADGHGRMGTSELRVSVGAPGA